MNIILLSGGSGKRLWPLSNDVRSKQFIKLFKDEEGNYESMVQRVFRQISRVDKDAKVTIATSKSQVAAIYNQLGDSVSVCVEPMRRDTFPAIALAATYLHDELNVSDDEAVVVCPVDPYVDDSYYEAVAKLGTLAEKNAADLTLMGIQPTYPSEKYGYIKPMINGGWGFTEKPTAARAAEYIADGALWNGGVIAYQLSYVLAKSRELLGTDRYEELFGGYSSLKKISFDYAVVEQETSIDVIRYAGTWKDLGTWNTLTESMEENPVGDARMNETCENVHIINDMGVPVLAMGLKNVVISASPEGILVSDIEQSIETYGVNEVLYDPWNAGQLIDRIGPKVDLVEIKQSLQSLSPMAKDFEAAVLDGRIIDPNPVMSWMISNCDIYKDPNGNIKPVKHGGKHSPLHIDGVVTSLMALGRLKSLLDGGYIDTRSPQEIEAEMTSKLSEIDY